MGAIFLLLLGLVCYYSRIFSNVSTIDPVEINVNDTSVGGTALDKFRSMMAPDLYRDFMKRDEYLIRWLQDQDFDLDKAQQKLKSSIIWRKENKIDTVLQEDFSDIARLCPYSLDGRDKSGRPLLAISVGPCPLRGIITSGRVKEIRRMIHYAFEKTSKSIQDLQVEGKPIVDGIIIADLNNFSWREHACLACLPVVIELLTLPQDHYPRYICKIIGINTPRIFQYLLTTVWPLLSEHSRGMLTFYAYDKNEWQTAILELISADQLEPQFGGTKKVEKDLRSIPSVSVVG